MDKIYKMIPMAAAAGLLAAAVTSCYKEDPLTPDESVPQYVIEDSDDPGQHYLYEFCQNTGVYILSEYEDVDYMWNVNSESSYTLTRMDPAILDDAVEYLRSVLTNLYGTGFAGKYFPYKILLADTIESNYFEDAVCGYGRSYLAVGRLRSDVLSGMTPAQILENLGAINGMLWGNFIYANNLITVPENFFTPSQDYYGQNVTNVFPDDDPETAIKKTGMWKFDPTGVYDTMLPDEEGDVAGFVETILTHTEEEIKAEMEGFDILLVKYNALIDAVKDACGIDLQEIGNRNVERFGSLGPAE